MGAPDSALPVFSFRPNWGAGITERMEWLTDILTSPTGAEQRISLRLTMRRTFEAKIEPVDNDRTFLDLFLRKFGGQEFMLPLWHDHAILDVAAAGGSSTLTFDTTDREFVDGGMAILMGDDALSCEAVEIDTVSAGSLTLVNPLVGSWSAGTTVHPLRRSWLIEQSKASLETDRFAEIPMQFLLSGAQDYDGGSEELATYNSIPILSPTPNWTGTIDHEFIRSLVETDNKVGLRSVFDTAGRGFSMQMHRWFLEGRDDKAAFRRLITRLRGRQGSLWLPTFASDLIVAAAASAGATYIDVEKCGLDYLDFPDDGRDLAITAAGEMLSLASLAAPPAAGVERINLTNPLTGTLAIGDALSFVDLGRLDSDAIEIFHLTDSDGVATVEAPFRTFPNVRDGSASGADALPTAAMDSDPCGCSPAESDCSTVIYNGPLVVEVAVPDPLPTFAQVSPSGVYFQVYMSLSVVTPSGSTIIVSWPGSSPAVDLYNSNSTNPPPFLGPFTRTIFDSECSRTAHVTVDATLSGGTLTITVEIDDLHFAFAPHWTDPSGAPSFWDAPYDYGDWVAVNVIGDNDTGQFEVDSFAPSATVSVGGSSGASAEQLINWYTGVDPRPGPDIPFTGMQFRCVPSLT